MKLRRISAFLLAVLLTAPLSACAPEEEPVIDGEGEPITLSVYYPPFCERRVISMEAILPYACPGVEIERYAVPERVSSPISRMQTEIMAGRGPDVIIDDGTLTRDYNMDVRKMMKAGVFWDMGPRLEADEDFDRSDYFEVILDAGMLDGHQYVMPLGFFVPVLMSTRELLEGHGVNVENCYTMQGLLKESASALERNPHLRLYSESWWEIWSLYDLRMDDFTAEYMFPAYFPDLMDFEAGELHFDQTVELAMNQWATDYHRTQHLTKREPLFTDLLVDIEQGQALWTVGQSPHYAFPYDAAALEWMGELVMIPLQNEQGETGARIILYGGVCSVSKHKEEAFQMLRLLFDGTLSEHTTIPVKKEQFDSYMDSAVMSMRSSVGNSPLVDFGRSIYYDTVDDIWIEKYRQWVEDSAYATLDSLQYQRIYDLFKPYFNGRRSFDQCVADAENYYSIYVSE